MAYVFFNPNPRKKLVGDCVIRAISKLTEQGWDDVYLGVVLQGYSLSDMPSANYVWESYLKDIGYVKTLLPDTCPNCYTVLDFCRDYPHGRYLVATGSHVVAVIDGDYYDSWDSGREPITEYWRKKDVVS